MCAGAGISSSALPVAVAGLAGIPGDEALARVSGNDRPTALDLAELIRSREVAAAWHSTGGTWTDIALGRFMLAALGDARLRKENLALAETAAAKGVALGPGNHHGWMRLVQLRTLRDAPGTGIAAPLKLALRTGPHEDRRDSLLLLTVEAGLLAWNHLDARERRLIVGKSREAWRRRPTATAAIAAKAGETARLAQLVELGT